MLKKHNNFKTNHCPTESQTDVHTKTNRKNDQISHSAQVAVIQKDPRPTCDWESSCACSFVLDKFS